MDNFTTFLLGFVWGTAFVCSYLVNEAVASLVFVNLALFYTVMIILLDLILNKLKEEKQNE